MVQSGMNQTLVKKKNRTTVLHCINAVGEMSRKDIADKTGLTPASLTQITSSLLDQGLLLETGKEMNGMRGRAKVMLELNREYGYISTLNIESANTFLAICDMQGNALCTERVKTEKTGEIFLSHVLDRMEKMIHTLSKKQQEKILGISVAIAGEVDPERGISLLAPGIFSEPVPVAKILEERFRLPVVVENNVKAFTVAENLYGMGKVSENLLIVKWGPGVGSALILNGSLYTGRDNRMPELGHFFLENTSLEEAVSYRYLNSVIPFEEENAEQVYLESEGKTRELFDDAIRTLARAIACVCCVLVPDRVMLYGSLAEGKALRERLIAYCRECDPFFSEETIIFSTLAEKKGYIGPTAVFVTNRVFEEE